MTPAPRLRRTAAALTASLAMAALLAGCATTASAPAETGAQPAPPASSAPAEPAHSPDAGERSALDERLLYILEEEKLAHDVYAALDAVYDRNPFTNIKESEIQHQEWLLPILEARGLDDPRTGVEGTFANPDIQALYDRLVEQGSKSWADAIAVGIEIEEADIADLEAAIEAETDPDAIAAYEMLLRGSENHLAAFQRQQG